MPELTLLITVGTMGTMSKTTVFATEQQKRLARIHADAYRLGPDWADMGDVERDAGERAMRAVLAELGPARYVMTPTDLKTLADVARAQADDLGTLIDQVDVFGVGLTPTDYFTLGRAAGILIRIAALPDMERSRGASPWWTMCQESPADHERRMGEDESDGA